MDYRSSTLSLENGYSYDENSRLLNHLTLWYLEATAIQLVKGDKFENRLEYTGRKVPELSTTKYGHVSPTKNKN